jgi:trans-L-3-hydroxyproline dehydratase
LWVKVRRLFSTVDAHAGGQPLRIVLSGMPPLKGNTYTEKRSYLREHHDDIRRILLQEPRGHKDMYGAVLLRSTTDAADYGVVFMTNEGYSTMCGHGVIALATALIETGTFPSQGPETRITFETPAGLIQARATVSDGRVRAVRFRNVPAFRLVHDLAITVDGQELEVDVAFGGAWYAVVSAEDMGISLRTAKSLDLAHAGMAVKAAVSNAVDVVHPTESDLSGLYGVILVDEPSASDLSMRNATIYANGALDRSPCGTGTSALVACMAAEGTMAVGDTLSNESLTGAVFTGRIVMAATIGDYDGVVTEISGRAAVTGMHQFMVDDDDPLPEGFLLR